MKLKELLKKALNKDLESDTDVSGVAQDSRKVLKGYVFVARSGEKSDGHNYAEIVAKKGAIAIVGERRLKQLAGLPYIQTTDAKLATAKLAAAFYDYPAKKLTTFGVTGTDGKTTTSFILHHLLMAEHKTGILSTAATKINSENVKMQGHFTTPESPEIQQLLAIFVDDGLSHAVIETSSHGFAQNRLGEINYDYGIWTNLTPEHLDFHKTFEEYRDVKMNLARRSAVSILNRDDESFGHFQKVAARWLSYGQDPRSDYRIQDVNCYKLGQRFKLIHDSKSYLIDLPMIGQYNVYNAVAAIAAAHESGLNMAVIIKRIKEFVGVPGRMQVIQTEPFRLIVDFAHTAIALKQALAVLKNDSKGKIIVVIGAAGERDKGKRFKLGKTAVENSDVAIFTEEDSRSESIIEILVEMSRGAIDAGGRATVDYWTIPDREEAIKIAINMAQAGDTILLAGKGHEHGLERKRETIPWNEVQIAQKYLSKKER